MTVLPIFDHGPAENPWSRADARLDAQPTKQFVAVEDARPVIPFDWRCFDRDQWWLDRWLKAPRG